jgi:excisionase family DNA binding protein
VLTKEQAQEKLGCEDRAFRRLVYAGKLIPTGFGKNWLFYESDVDAYVNSAALATKEQILSGSQKVIGSCIYFLINQGEIVYVGQTVKSFRRISDHVDKEFDAFHIIPTSQDDLNRLEKLYIARFKPKYNKVGVGA